MRNLNAGSDLNIVPGTFENQRGNKTSGRELPTDKPTKPSNTYGDIAAASKIIYYAQKVIENESLAVGTACNFYIHRVLKAAGFVDSIYLANDFDVYAKKYFKHYKTVDFQRDANGSAEVARLKQHLWSYPERTPFITQWSKSGVHGHIAFVERIGEKLVIYQSSLGTKLPHKDQTTPDILLNGYDRRQLTVYSEMTPE